MEHTKEPWTVYEGEECHGVLDSEGKHLADMWQRKHYDSLANARRIVACVNACEGIPTETLENDDWDTVVEKTVIAVTKDKIKSLTADRDRWKALALELGDALKKLVYLSDEKWYTGRIGDFDVTKEVGPVLSKLQDAQDEGPGI